MKQARDPFTSRGFFLLGTGVALAFLAISIMMIRRTALRSRISCIDL
jgi:hypothetical protein